MNDLVTAVILGAIQGLTEWLPVSSEGFVVIASRFLIREPLEEAIAYALWLHLGTALAAIVFFRQDIAQIICQIPYEIKIKQSRVRFLLLATIVSAVTAFPLLILLDETSSRVGSSSMILLGAFMALTGITSMKGRLISKKSSGLNAFDACLVGFAQGIAAVPGLSRSGLTVASLLARGIEKTQALRLSFLLGIPASLGAALFVGIGQRIEINVNAVVGILVAAVVGWMTIKGLMVLANRVNFGIFTLIMGALVATGGLLGIFD